MRFTLAVVLAALLIVIMYLVLSWFVDGYFGGNVFPDNWGPDAWVAPDSWNEWRDIVIVIGGLFFALAGLLLCVLLLVLIYLALSLRRMLSENVAPAIDSARDLVDEVRGTTEFVGETTVSPIIRVYSIIAGIRRGLGTVGSISQRLWRN